VFSLLTSEVSHKIYELSPELITNEKVKIGGMVSSLRIVLTKKGNAEMAFATIEDGTGKIETVVFPRIYEATRSLWVKEQLIFVEGRVEVREESLSLIVENATPISEQVKPEEKYDFEIALSSGISPNKLVAINRLLKNSPGKQKGVLYFENNGGRKRLVLTFGVDYTAELKKKIKETIES
jgi:DNA polymerase-3 subunit alpha